MLSASSNARYPGLSARRNERLLGNNAENANQLDPDQLKLWSHEVPELQAGKYTINIHQSIQVETSDTSHDLPTLIKNIHVPVPQLKLPSPEEIHSVYPAQGQSEHSNALAHVVFKHPTIPWERLLTDDTGHFNRTPWLAVLSFSEDELILDGEDAKGMGLQETPSRYGSVSTTAANIQQATKIACPLNSTGIEKSYEDDDKLSVLLLRKKIFENIFKKREQLYDVSPYAFMAHVREIHGGFMASADSEIPQPQYSVVISPRTGPVGADVPVRVVTHLISLEGISNLDIGDRNFVGLVSLHSWDWMCVPPEHDSFSNVMAALSAAVQPLRVPDQYLKEFVESAKSTSETWLHDRLHTGYTLKPHTVLTGEKTSSLLRGPFIPTLPDVKGIKGYSLDGNGLSSVDKETGMLDISYSCAWNLGRTLALADRPFSSSLLRLRGKARALSLKRAKANANNDNPITINAYMNALGSAIQDLKTSHKADKIRSESATARWYRTPDQRANLPVTRLANSGKFNQPAYLDTLEGVMPELFGLPKEGTLEARQIDPDALAVRKWIIDKLYLAGLPLHYLVIDPDMLPRETIRTFCIDPVWVDAMIDGGLSLANHHAKDDDSLRREIKNAVNEFLKLPLKEGPKEGTVIQVPRWGFLMRSIAVTAFPDLKVEAPLGAGTPAAVNEVLYMQVVADDVLLCLFDRIPGENGFTEIVIKQPNHQQSYSLGVELSTDTLTSMIRPIPVDPMIKPDVSQQRKQAWTKTPDGRTPVYDWDTRMMNPQEYAQQAMKEMKEASGTYFVWEKEDQIPSSLLASQLGKPALQLRLEMPAPEVNSAPNSSPDDLFTPGRDARQLFVAPRPNIVTETPPKNSDEDTRPLPEHAPLPKGSRQPPSKVVIDPSSIPVAKGPLKDDKKPDMVLETIIQHPSRYYLRPRHTSVFDIAKPQQRNELSITPNPVDVVFELRDPLNEPPPLNTGPLRLEVRIPVTLENGDQPQGVNSTLATLISIPGTAAAPNLPRVRPVNRGQRWKYSTKLVLGRMYPATEKQGVYFDNIRIDPAPETDLQVLLVVTIFNLLMDKMNDPEIAMDATFVLESVKLKDWDGGQGTQSQVPCNFFFEGLADAMHTIPVTLKKP